MANVNKVILLGRLGQDPESKTLNGGQTVCNFSIATSESYIDKQGQKVEKTEWHKVNVWGPIAVSCAQYLNKGSMAYVEGQLTTRSYEDSNGIKKYVTEIKAFTVQFIGGNSGGDQERENPFGDNSEVPY